nr:LOW QUALITY PROTEIN: kunitz-type serine protease inhibitor HCRG1-like [Penaeus vannamei]
MEYELNHFSLFPQCWRLFLFLSLVSISFAFLRPKGDIAEIVCHQPKVVGPCKASFPMFYYNFDKNECLPFIYGGCGGNQNNFETEEACWWLCGR